MSMAGTLRSSQIASLGEVDAAEWNALTGDNPLLQHEFLLAMEMSGCVGRGTHWQGCHLLLHDHRDRLAGAMPLYLKGDSHGEFVFDWSWADAYERAGLDYYPKLVSAIPFTPATGSRLLVRDDKQANDTHGLYLPILTDSYWTQWVADEVVESIAGLDGW
jgi:predicted N-acyltransferase